MRLLRWPVERPRTRSAWRERGCALPVVLVLAWYRRLVFRRSGDVAGVWYASSASPVSAVLLSSSVVVVGARGCCPTPRPAAGAAAGAAPPAVALRRHRDVLPGVDVEEDAPDELDESEL